MASRSRPLSATITGGSNRKPSPTTVCYSIAVLAHSTDCPFPALRDRVGLVDQLPRDRVGSLQLVDAGDDGAPCRGAVAIAMRVKCLGSCRGLQARLAAVALHHQAYGPP